MKKNKDNSGKSYPKWYYVVMLMIPIFFVFIVEFFLRVIDYGVDFTTFKPISNYYPDKIFLNPDLPLKYFSNLENSPSVLPDGFDKVKKDNAFRVFVIGGSTTAGWPYVPNASFSRQLKRRLELLYPDNYIEIINCGVSAINSYSLRDFIPGILDREPDLILIYAGHNEYYGALGVGSSVNLGDSRSLINTYIWLKNFRTTQLLGNIISGIYQLLDSGKSEKNIETNETLMSRMIGESLITFNSDTYWKGIEQFEENLRDIFKMTNENGIPVIIGKLTSNTLDLKPFYSIHTNEFPEADSIYYSGRLAYVDGKIAEADSLLTLAKELDALRFRAPQKINDVINNLGKEFEIVVIDIDSLFRAHSQNGIVGYNLIVDHLHPNIEGHSFIAKALYSKMKKLNYLPSGNELNISILEQDSILLENFPFTKLDSTISELKIIQLTGAYPFVPKGIPNYKKLNYKIDTFIDSLSLGVINKDIKWETAHINLAEKYFSQRRYKEFIKEVEAVIQERPYYDQPYEYLITKLVDAGFASEAIPYLFKLYNLNPTYFATKWLGQLLLFSKDYKNALRFLDEAARFSEADSQTWYNLAGAYYYNGQIKEAISALTNSLNLNPENQLAKDFYKQIKPLTK